MDLSISIQEINGEFVATCARLMVKTTGATREEALMNIQRAIVMCESFLSESSTTPEGDSARN